MSWETSFHFDVYISLQGSLGFSLSNCSILFFHSYFLSFMILGPIVCFFSIIWSLKGRKFQSFRVKLINTHIKQIPIVICRACLHALLCPTLTTGSLPGACQVPQFMEFSRQGYWSGLPFPPLQGVF